MKCPECKDDNVLWDYKTGTIVCGNCGLVIDYIYELPRQRYDLGSIHSLNIRMYNKARYRISEIQTIRSKIKIHHKLIHRTKEYQRIIRKLKKKSITIDEEAFKEYLEGKRGHVKLFRHKHLALTKNIPEKIEEIIKKVIDNDPILASRTERAKIALAYIILGLLVENNDNLDLRRIAKNTSLSITHVKRLLALIRRRQHILKIAQHLLSNGISNNINDK